MSSASASSGRHAQTTVKAAMRRPRAAITKRKERGGKERRREREMERRVTEAGARRQSEAQP